MKEFPRYFLQEANKPKNLSRAATVLASVTVAGVAACGGGGSADNPSQTGSIPDETPGNTLVVTASPFETPEVTPIPTSTEAPLWGPAPEFNKVETAINSAFAKIDTSELADPLDNLEEFNKNLRWCNEVINEPIDVPQDQLGMSLIGSCAALGQTLARLYDENKDDPGKAELFEAALYAVRDFTMGKVDKFATDPSQLMPPDIEAYKKSLLGSSFTLVK